MYIKFIVKILSFFDYFKKKDVINFFKKNISSDINNLIDVGAHHGETIKLFNQKFNVDNTYAFEPSYKNFKILEKETKNISKTNLRIYNYGIGEKEGSFDFNESAESQSSTLVKINEKSKYYKRKIKLLGAVHNGRRPFLGGRGVQIANVCRLEGGRGLRNADVCIFAISRIHPPS